MFIIYLKITIGIEKNELENTYYNVLTFLLKSFIIDQFNLISKLKAHYTTIVRY